MALKTERQGIKLIAEVHLVTNYKKIQAFFQFTFALLKCKMVAQMAAEYLRHQQMLPRGHGKFGYNKRAWQCNPKHLH